MSPRFSHFAFATVGLLAAALSTTQGQTYSYDGAGRLATAAYPDGSGVRYTYDASGNLTTVSALQFPLAPPAPALTSPEPTAVQLAWTDLATNESGYIVQRRSVETDTWNTVAELPAGSASFTDRGLTAGTEYVYRVRAISPAGDSAYSPTTAIAVSAGNPAAQLINISIRARVGVDSDVLIAGFQVAGDEPRPVLIRGIGPGLLAFDPSLPNTLADPVLQIFDSSSRQIATNDNWSESPNAVGLAAAFAATGAFPLPAGSRDAALQLTLDPGTYSAVVSGANRGTGVALTEVYNERPAASGSRLANLSSRVLSGVDADAMIVGFVVRGEQPKQLLVRAAGPALLAFGVTGILSNPRFTVYSGSTPVATNDNWNQAAEAAAIRTTAAAAGAFAFAEGSLDAARLLTLDPGTYTVIVSGEGNTTGVALVEVYEVTP